jgi:hypothetical protein
MLWIAPLPAFPRALDARIRRHSHALAWLLLGIAAIGSAQAAAQDEQPCSVIMVDCVQTAPPAQLRAPAKAPSPLKQQLDAGRVRLARPPSAVAQDAQSLGAIVIEGQSELSPRDPVKSAFERHLPAARRSGVENWVRDDGARCTVDHDCRGIFCAVMCTAADGSMSNHRPGGFSLR